MRSPLQDANAGAAMNVAPTKKHAVRTATIAKQNNNANIQDMQNSQKIGNLLGGAIGNFMESKNDDANELRYREAFNAHGAKTGMSEYRRDQKRTGFTEFIFNGQSPEYRAELDASARNASTAMYVEESAYVDAEGGQLTSDEYQSRLYQKVKAYTEENFADAPDATLAFMKNWQDNSNELTRQQTKVREVTRQREIAATASEGFQQDFSKYKQLIAQNPELSVKWGRDIMLGKNLPKGMDPKAGRNLIKEQTFVSMEAGDISALQLMRDTNLADSFTAKEISRYQAGLTYLDTNNEYSITTAKNTLDKGVADAIRNGTSVDDVFATYNSTRLQVSARNTFTSRHQRTVSGSELYGGKAWDNYRTTRSAEKLVKGKIQSKKVDEGHAEFKLNDSIIVANKVPTEQRNITTRDYMTDMFQLAANPDTTIEARTKAIENATEAQKLITKSTGDSESDKESTISSKANLISAQYNLNAAHAKSNGTTPSLTPNVEKELRELLVSTESDDTKALITNLLTNVEKVKSGALEQVLKAESEDEVMVATDENVEWEGGLETISSNIDLTPQQREEQELSYIQSRIEHIMNQQDSPQFDSTSKDHQDLLNDQVNDWRKKLSGKATTRDVQERKRQLALEKQAKHKAVVDSDLKAIKDGKIRPTATKAQREEATDALVMENLRTPLMDKLTDKEVVDTAFSNGGTVLGLINDIGKYSNAIEDSPLLKDGMNASFSRLITTDPASKQQQAWTDENKAAVEVMQTAYGNSTLWSQLGAKEQRKALYLVDAFHAGVDRSVAMTTVNTENDVGNVEPNKSMLGWDGIVDKLKLSYANDNLQAHARSTYDFLRPKLGHDRAVEHTQKLVQYQDISTDSIDIKHGASFPEITFKTLDDDGKEIQKSVKLKEVANDMEHFSLTMIKGVLNQPDTIDLTSPANVLATQLIGNSTTKDGRTIRSLKEIPGGVTVEMIGDNLIFVSNYGTLSVNETSMSVIAASIHEGKKRNELANERTRRQQTGSDHTAVYTY